mmetsp:Transcript_65525/g.188864  ORF Transcript_65525/g.188864 Transcript_65525/m.188864 type:complete len:482 (+) Transcript_65525:2-1447(+)
MPRPRRHSVSSDEAMPRPRRTSVTMDEALQVAHANFGRSVSGDPYGADDIPEQPPPGRRSLSKVHGGRPGLRAVVDDDRATSRSFQPLVDGDVVRVTVSRSKGQPWRISFFAIRKDKPRETELLGLLRLGEFPPDELHPAVEFLPSPETRVSEIHDIGSSKVRLSFAPEVVDEQDSLHEVFVTLFNTVSNFYCRRHERGVIGEVALRWLTEAASHALDCANRDKHAARVVDFKHVQKTKELDDALSATVGPIMKRGKSNRSIRTMKSLRSTGACSIESNPFAPIVVEYLAIEHRCSRVSWWDHYPRSWKFDEFVRSFGYHATNAKVETLSTFVEAHERVLEELAHLERFAAVRSCLEEVISAAKRDLRLVEELNPRRFFYSKHANMLKICISGRMHTLEEQVEEGWIGEADAAPLLMLARELMAEIEAHRPRVVTNWRATSQELGKALEDLPARNDAWADTFAAEGGVNAKQNEDTVIRLN